MFERLLEDLGGLRPEHDQAVVEQKRRDCVDADRVRFRGRECHAVPVQVAADRSLGSLEPDGTVRLLQLEEGVEPGAPVA